MTPSAHSDLVVVMGAVCRAATELAAAVQRSPRAVAPSEWADELDRLVDATSRMVMQDARAGEVISRLPDLSEALAELSEEAEPDES